MWVRRWGESGHTRTGCCAAVMEKRSNSVPHPLPHLTFFSAFVHPIDFWQSPVFLCSAKSKVATPLRSSKVHTDGVPLQQTLSRHFLFTAQSSLASETSGEKAAAHEQAGKNQRPRCPNSVKHLHLHKGAFREMKTEVARSWPALNSSTKTDVKKHQNETLC